LIPAHIYAYTGRLRGARDPKDQVREVLVVHKSRVAWILTLL
jgi:hypothetical protein